VYRENATGIRPSESPKFHKMCEKVSGPDSLNPQRIQNHPFPAESLFSSAKL
jgi:hypothetical protein